jgi:hypothetical protein
MAQSRSKSKLRHSGDAGLARPWVRTRKERLAGLRVMARLRAGRPSSPRSCYRRWENHSLFALELVSNPSVERGEVKLLECRDAVFCDHVGEAADYAREQSRPGGVVWRQVSLDPEGRYIVESGLLDNRAEARSDHRGCAGRAKRPHDPADHVSDQTYWRFSAGSAEIEIDGDEQTARAKVLNVMANGAYWVREVKEHEPTDNCVERFVATPTANLALDERYVTLFRCLDALACNGKRLDGPIESNHRPLRTDQLSCETRHMTESCAEIEHAQAGNGESGRLEKQAARRRD